TGRVAEVGPGSSVPTSASPSAAMAQGRALWGDGYRVATQALAGRSPSRRMETLGLRSGMLFIHPANALPCSARRRGAANNYEACEELFADRCFWVLDATIQLAPATPAVLCSQATTWQGCNEGAGCGSRVAAR